MFGELAESLLGITVVELMKLDDENRRLNCGNINDHLEHKELIVHIKKKMIESHYATEDRYTVASLIQAEQLSTQTEVKASSSSIPSIKQDTEASYSTQVESAGVD